MQLPGDVYGVLLGCVTQFARATKWQEKQRPSRFFLKKTLIFLKSNNNFNDNNITSLSSNAIVANIVADPAD